MDAQIVKVILEAVFGVVTILITSYLLPWLKSLVGESKYNAISDFTELAVRSAEQIYTPEQWEEKKKYVVACVKIKASQIGIDLSATDIETLVEGLVNAVKKG